MLIHAVYIPTVHKVIFHENAHVLSCFLRNIIVIMAVEITEITLAIIEGNLKPSGACRIYPNAINVQRIAGINAIIYGFSLFIR